jgi:MoaA/NifB/PqqE/SkfB family radical SAM enzyme
MIKRLLYSPFLVQIVPTRRCNLRCGYCNEYERDSEHVKYSVMLERLRKIRSLGALAIEFSGGEPLLHPDIYKLITFCSGVGFLRRMLITNGYLINEESIAMLNYSGLNDLQISIDGVEPNKMTVKTLKPLKKKLVALKKHAEFRVMINAVIGSAPNREVEEVVKCAVDMGFKPRVGLIHDSTGRLYLTPEQIDLYQDLQKYLGSGIHEAGGYRARLMRGKAAPFKCRAGSRYLYVDEFGRVSWCSQTRELFSKDLMSYSVDDLKQQFYLYKPCNSYCTVACVRTTSKLDSWRSQKQNE